MYVYKQRSLLRLLLFMNHIDPPLMTPSTFLSFPSSFIYMRRGSMEIKLAGLWSSRRNKKFGHIVLQPCIYFSRFSLDCSCLAERFIWRPVTLWFGFSVKTGRLILNEGTLLAELSSPTCF